MKKYVHFATWFVIFSTVFSSLASADRTDQWTDQATEIDFQERVRQTAPQPKIIEEIRRSEVLERAYAALNYVFLYREENAASWEIKNLCSPESGNYWLRPIRLNEQIDKRVRAIPYKWGGYFIDLDFFTEGVRQGRLVGDVCTCRAEKYNYCLIPRAIGLDCSGFVSYAWKTSYHVTSALHEISQEIPWEELKSGDALNKAGSHVRLFVSFADHGKKKVNIIESSLTCEGVCENTFSVKELKQSGYVPLRYVNIRD